MGETALTGTGSAGGTPEGGTSPASGTGTAGTGQQPQLPSWRGSLSEDIRGEKSFDVFKGDKWDEVGPVMAKSFLDSQKMIGNSIRIPGKDAKPEDWNTFYNKLGRPEKPEGYAYKRPQFVSKDVQWDEGMEKEFINTAHQIGLNNDQVQKIIDWQGKYIEGRAVSAREQIKTTLGELKKEWGPDYESKLILGERAVRQIGGDRLVDVLERTGLGNNIDLVKAFAEIGNILAEDGLIDGRIDGRQSPEDIEKQIQTMMLDKTHPLNDISHPNHNAAVEELTRLNQILFKSKR